MTAGAARHRTIEGLDVTVCTIPTDEPESDATLDWDATTIVLVQAHAGTVTGLGYTYGPPAIADIVERLEGVVCGRRVLDVPASWWAMRGAVRNFGQSGLTAMAISAVDVALWALAARTLELALCSLLGRCHERVPIYGSGGFCSYSDDRLAEQLGGWAAQGIPRLKMKVGRRPEEDRRRARVAREAIGPDTQLFVDANGAFDRDEAIRWAHIYAQEYGVTYFEEPVSSDDLDGLARVRDHAPAGLVVAAGGYAFTIDDVRAMLPAVGIQQADVTRCGGITGLLRAGALCETHHVPFSVHCAPAIGAHACTAIAPLAHVEYFHDHVRVESLLFEGTLRPEGGFLTPDTSRPGLGLAPRAEAVARHRVARATSPP